MPTYKTRAMVATKPFTYAGKPLLAGDAFEPSERDGKLLELVGKARRQEVVEDAPKDVVEKMARGRRNSPRKAASRKAVTEVGEDGEAPFQVPDQSGSRERPGHTVSGATSSLSDGEAES